MDCTCPSQTLAGLCKDCDGSVGGIVEVYIATYGSISGTPSVNTDSGDTGSTKGMITGITMVESAKFYKYQFRKNTGSLTSTLNVTDDGNVYVETELSLVFSKMETKKRIEMNALSTQDLVAIVKDANGKYWYLGYNEPVNASGGEGATGTNRTDSNHYGIILKDTSNEYPFEVSATVINTLPLAELTN